MRAILSRGSRNSSRGVTVGVSIEESAGRALVQRVEQDAMAEGFEVGDIVQLKSGGPKMTVIETARKTAAAHRDTLSH